MKLIKIHRGHLQVEVSGRTVTVEGEGFNRPASQIALPLGYVDYVVYTNTLRHWDEPWSHEPLPLTVQTKILAFLKADFEQRGLLLAIE